MNGESERGWQSTRNKKNENAISNSVNEQQTWYGMRKKKMSF